MVRGGGAGLAEALGELGVGWGARPAEEKPRTAQGAWRREAGGVTR